MKTIILFCILSFAFITSCNKEDAKAKDGNVNPKTLESSVNQSMTDREKFITYSSDSDYKFIADNSLEIINKLISSKTDLTKVDFTDLPTVLKILNMSKEKYLEKAIEVKNAAARFILRYNINSPGGNHFCSSCEISDLQKASTIGNMLSNFQNNKSTYSKFTSRLTQDFSKKVSATEAANQVVSPDEVAPCSNWVYACIALCALTAETGPVYFLCCAYCLHAECPNE